MRDIFRTNLLLIGIGRIIKFYVFFLVIFLIARVAFTLYFADQSFLEQNYHDILTAFYMGWKYDTLVISYLIIPIFFLFILLALIGNQKIFLWSRFPLRAYFLFFSLLIPLILISDLGFYSFFQDHINILFFGLFEDDTSALIESIYKNYPLVEALILFTLYAFFSFYCSLKIFPKGSLKSYFFLRGSLLKFSGISILGFILLFGGARGGYGDLVLSPKYSDFSKSEFINQMAINGVIALDKTIRVRVRNNRKDFNLAKAMGYENDIHEAFADYLGIDVSLTDQGQLINLIKRKTSYSDKLENEKINVVVFMMESFGASWIDYQSDNFNFLGGLKKHFEEDYYFQNFISSDNGTIGSLVSLASNIPPRPGKRFLSESKYMQTKLTSSAHLPFKKNGHETMFLYGGKLGWRDIGRYFKYQDYDHIVGENRIKSELNLRGRQGTEWGLYDEHFFSYVFEKLNKSTRPLFILGLSTSNHPPFEVPKSFKKNKIQIPIELKKRISRENDLFLKRFMAFSYSNEMLARFISKVKQSKKLRENTIIAVTGDHNFWGFMNYKKEEVFKKYTVPFYLYVPEKLKVDAVNLNKISSHEDIMPTLYHLSLSDTEYLSFGEDLFSVSKSYAINSSLYASQEGLYYKNKPYHWSQIPFVNSRQAQKDFFDLKKRYRSTMAISDFYLEYEYQKERSN